MNISAFDSDMDIANKMTTDKGYELLQDTYYGNRKIGFFIGDGSSTSRLKSDIEVITDKWYYIVGRYDGYNMEIYIDGTPDDNTRAHSGNITNADKSLYIGNNFSGTTNLFSGIIDEVRISNSARSTT